VTLSDPKLLGLLHDRFVCGWRNIGGVESYAGKSHNHPVKSTALHTSNGAGGRNIQMLMISPTGNVLHCLPGFWSPVEMFRELELGLELLEIDLSDKSLAEKRDEFLLAHLNHAAKHPRSTVAGSHLQGFDKKRERDQEESDFRRKTDGEVARTVDQVMHERMAQRPLFSIEKFDIAAVVDYGTSFYDKAGDGCCDLGKGKPTMPKGKMKKKYNPEGWKKN